MAHGHTASSEDQEEAGLMVMPDELSCPISFQLMTDPVLADDGHTYQRQAIEEWISRCTACKEAGKA
jgi:pyridoxal/pyridoxine/pyridoxamine kinase